MISIETPYHLLLYLTTISYIIIFLHHLAPALYTKRKKQYVFLTLTLLILLTYSWVDSYLISSNPEPPENNSVIFQISYILSCFSCAIWLTLLNQLLELQKWGLVKVAWGLAGLVILLSFTPILIQTENASVFNNYSQCWYHGKQLGVLSIFIAGFYILSMLSLSIQGCLQWKRFSISDRLYSAISLGVVLMAIIDILVFLNIMEFYFTWSLSCAFFAIASSLRLGASAAKTAVELEHANEKLKKYHNEALKMQHISSIGLIVRGIVHDLKNYFYITSQISELGIETVDAEKYEDAKSHFKTIEDSAAKAEQYLMNMLEMTDDSHNVKLETVKLYDLIAMIIKVCGLQLHIPKISVSIHVPRQSTVTTDPRVLQQILLNLTFNAIKALSESSSENREISYIFREQENKAILIVEDTGPGLPPDAIRLLQSDSALSSLTAKGVGLRLILQGCKKLGIHLRHISKEINYGTRFELEF